MTRHEYQRGGNFKLEKIVFPFFKIKMAQRENVLSVGDSFPFFLNQGTREELEREVLRKKKF